MWSWRGSYHPRIKGLNKQAGELTAARHLSHLCPSGGDATVIPGSSHGATGPTQLRADGTATRAHYLPGLALTGTATQSCARPWYKTSLMAVTVHREAPGLPQERCPCGHHSWQPCPQDDRHRYRLGAAVLWELRTSPAPDGGQDGQPARGRSQGRTSYQRTFQSSLAQRCPPLRCHLPLPVGSEDWEVGIHHRSDMEIGPEALSDYLHPRRGRGGGGDMSLHARQSLHLWLFLLRSPTKAPFLESSR